MNKIELVRFVTRKLDGSGMVAVNELSFLIKQNGIFKDMHVGQDEEFFEVDNHVAEWILGQYLGIMKQKQFHMLNALINYSYTWMEGKS